ADGAPSLTMVATRRTAACSSTSRRSRSASAVYVTSECIRADTSDRCHRPDPDESYLREAETPTRRRRSERPVRAPWSPAVKLEELVLAAEDRRDGVVGKDVHDRLGEEAGDRQHGELLGLRERVDRNRVRDDDALDRVGVGEGLERVTAEETVCCVDPH